MSIDGNPAVLVALIAAVAFTVWLLTIPFHAWAPRCLQFAWSRVIRACKGNKKKPWNTTVVLDTDVEGPKLVLGSMPLAKAQLEELACQHRNKLAIVSLNASWELVLKEPELKTMGIEFLRLPTPDFFAPSLKDIEQGIAFIEEQLQAGTSVLCHCHAGRGRSAVVVICFLMKHCCMNLIDAFTHVKARRKIARLDVCCRLRPQWRACRGYERHIRCQEQKEAHLQSTWADEVKIEPAKVGTSKVGIQLD